MTATQACLGELLKAPGPLVVAECYSVLTARVVEHAGFKATYVGGQAMGAMHAAVPDHGLVTTHEMVEHVARIASSIGIPLIADADQGGETPLNVRRAVRDFEHAGASAIHLEDTINPKHLSDGDRLVSIDVMRSRIAAAIDGRRSDDFLIIARTDELVINGTVDETIRRGIAFAREGADIFMPVNIRGLPAMQAITSAVPIPVLDINHPIEVAQQGGLKVDLFANSAVPTAVQAHLAMLTEITATGGLDTRARRLDPSYLATLIDDPTYLALAKSWAERLADGMTEEGAR